MWTSFPVHIYPHLSKVRFLLETNGGINEQCLQWVPYIPGTIAHDCSIIGGQNLLRGIQEGLIGRPYQDSTKKEGAIAPLGHLEALWSNRKISCTTYLIPLKHEHILISASFP